MKQKKRISVLTALSVVIFVLGAAALGYSIFFGHEIEKELETVVVLRQAGSSVDLPNKEQGTVVISLKAPESEILVGESEPTRVILFRSNTVDGLSIEYLFGEKRLISGIPSIESQVVDIFDGNMHQIAYSFMRGDMQMLFLDGVKLAEGKFDPTTELTVTGFMVKMPENELSADAENDMVLYDRAMSEEEIKGLAE